MYSGDLKAGLVWILNGQKEVGLQIFWILNGIWDMEAQPFEIWTKGHRFVINHLKSWQKCPDFEWSGYQMVGIIAIAKAWPFENWSIWNLIFKNSGFQIPTVLHTKYQHKKKLWHREYKQQNKWWHEMLDQSATGIHTSHVGHFSNLALARNVLS